jgi:hypothetical protein
MCVQDNEKGPLNAIAAAKQYVNCLLILERHNGRIKKNVYSDFLEGCKSVE